jgi:heme/copper-type cytochrome/quinol oxidase subunit 1
VKKLWRSPAAWGIASLIAVGISYAVAGNLGAIGMACGILGTAFNMFALWLIVRLLGGTMADRPLPKFGAFATVVMFLIKLPVLILLGFAMQRLGEVALTHFLIGLGLVYFALVGWSQSQD